MAKKKTNDNFFADIAKQTGGISLADAGNVPYFIDTGSLALNYICSGKFISGGIPGGRITEFYGPPATAKSLLGYSCLASVQRMDGIGVLLDCERAGSADFASAAGHVDCTKLITYEPVSIEQVEKKLIAATNAIRQYYGPEKPILFVWDSIGVTPTEREWKEVDLPENATAADIKKAGGNARPGERAKASGDLLRKINPFMNEQNASIFVINQTRKNIGVLYGNPETTGGGGEALKFYASCRLRTSIGKYIENKTGLPLGINLTFANKKSRSFVPGIKTTGVQLFFQQGINPLGGLLSILLQAGRIEKYASGRYRVLEPWADGQDVTFQAKVADNDVPIEMLLKAPKVIDAADEREVQDYLALFSGAIQLATGDSIVEKAPTEDEEPDFIADLKSDDDE